MAIIRGTTPVISLDLEGVDFTGYTVYATLDQNGEQITKSGEQLAIEPLYADEEETEVIGSTVHMFLSQDDTLRLEQGRAEVQVRWVNDIDEAFASDIGQVQLSRVLLEEVITYGN